MKKGYILLIAIILFGGILRGLELQRQIHLPLEPDAIGYKTYALRMDIFSKENGFYSGNFGTREPFFIFVVKLFFSLLGTSDASLRLVSFLFSLILIFLTYLVGRRWFNQKIGLITSFFVAAHPYFIFCSARGLREEVCSCLLLFFLYLCLREDISPLKRSVPIGIFGGLIFLTRSENLSIIFLILLSLLYFQRRTWKIWHTLLSILISLILFLPHLYGLYRTYGNPFYTAHIQLRASANLEFCGEPWYPITKEERDKDAYAGGPIGGYEYFFKLHKLHHLFTYTALGYCKIYLGFLGYSIFPTKGGGPAISLKAKKVVINPSKETIHQLLDTVFKNLYPLFPFFTAVGSLFCVGLFFGILTVNSFLLFLFIVLPLNLAFFAWTELATPRNWLHIYIFMAILSSSGVLSLYEKIHKRWM